MRIVWIAPEFGLNDEVGDACVFKSDFARPDAALGLGKPWKALVYVL